jgi:hypothetical protein
MEFESQTEQDYNPPTKPLEARSISKPDRQSLLVAVRVVLDLPHSLTTLKGEESE